MSHDTSPPQSAPEAAASPVVSASLTVRGLADDWAHCQQVADYLARFAASDRFDPEQLTTRLSTYLNEVLELVLRSEPGEGAVVITVERAADRLQIAVAVPAGRDGGEYLRSSMRAAAEPDVAAAYRRSFAAQVQAGDDEGVGVGLLELIALHGIKLGLREAEGGLVLSMIVPHEP